ncbi:ribbon-helix-helix domain-containing protein [Enterovirga sp. CN4-39]|uniref:ribbon-helix-helix domain-containing protein n=1 Tax=Enterovirga sp. CN4-39 TaxID=3400910 RepID=UPI003C0A3625
MPLRNTVTLTDDEAAFVQELVASGQYRSEHDVIAAGLEALRTTEADLESWLREEVVPVAAQMTRHPERAIPADQVFEEIRAHHRRRIASLS